MTWFKVDDALATHDKVLAAGNAAMGLWVRAGAWSSQHLTDGDVPMHAVRLLGTRGQADALVRAGLWLKTSQGYRFHEWHDYQPSRKKVESDRQAARERMRAIRAGSPEVRPNTDECSPEVRDPSVRDPRPVPSRPDPVVTSPSQSPPHRLSDDGLERVMQAIGSHCPKAHARRSADMILAKANGNVRDPTRYVLKAIEAEPDLYRYRRGNPTKATECPDHPGEWADRCRIHASEAP